MFELCQVSTDVQLTAFDVVVHRRAFLHQQDAENDHRENRDHQTNAQRAKRGQVALPAEFEL